MNIVVLMGGSSAERPISLRTGAGIARALRARGHEVTALDPATGAVLLPGTEEAQGALPAGEVALAPREGTALRQREPRCATRSWSSSRCTAARARTARSRRCSTWRGRPTPARACCPRRWRWTRRSRRSCSSTRASRRRRGGSTAAARARCPTTRWRSRSAATRWSSSRTTRARRSGSRSSTTRRGSRPAYEEALRYSNQVLVEAFIPGRELTVAVLGDQALPIVEIQPEERALRLRVEVHGGEERVLLPGRPRRGQDRARCRSSRSAPAARSTPRASRASTSASRPTARRTASRSTRSPA